MFHLQRTKSLNPGLSFQKIHKADYTGSYMMDLFNINFVELCTEEDKKKHLKKLRQELLLALWECVPFRTDSTSWGEYIIQMETLRLG
ncbi:hypothetical protein M422DRAFT_262630 [Sphaerobolus stellatus SS14]|uniref:Uncharacterized protein n=1 Tax=Sphaerobolus stellatus (strain SS14) TaxID=990650 RepID=A0A0C9VCX5_SPHS4|nr:hypothetical protein M422DRAFT_262630 [Sphaerobolus stellatus SS14]